MIQRSANGWYEMHSLLRQFAGQQVSRSSSQSEPASLAGRRHSQYFLGFLAAREPQLLGPEPHLAAAQIRRCVDDIRLAWQRAGSQGWVAALAGSLDGLALFYELSGLFEEGAQTLDWTVARLQQGGEEMINSPDAAGLMSRLLGWQAQFINRSGRAPEAIDLLIRALALAEQSGQTGNQADVHSLLGEMLPHRGEFDLAQQYQHEAIAFYRAAADDHRLATALTRLGVTRWRRGSYDGALVCFQEARGLQQRLQNRMGTAKVLWSMGGVAFEQRRYGEALTYAREARETYEAMGDRWGMATLDGNLALLSQIQSDYEAALAYNQKDLDYDLETGNRHGEAVALGNRGLILLDAGRLDEALDCFRRAMRIQQALGNIWEVARHRASVASILVWQKEPVLAMAEYQRAVPVLREHGARFYLVDPLLQEAHLLVDQRALTLAKDRAREVGELTGKLGIDDQQLSYRILQARLDHAAGSPGDAVEQLHNLAGQSAAPAERAITLYWLWRIDGNELVRNEAITLYQELHGRLPKYEYAVRLRELQEQSPR